MAYFLGYVFRSGQRRQQTWNGDVKKQPKSVTYVKLVWQFGRYSIFFLISKRGERFFFISFAQGFFSVGGIFLSLSPFLSPAPLSPLFPPSLAYFIQSAVSIFNFGELSTKFVLNIHEHESHGIIGGIYFLLSDLFSWIYSPRMRLEAKY